MRRYQWVLTMAVLLPRSAQVALPPRNLQVRWIRVALSPRSLVPPTLFRRAGMPLELAADRMMVKMTDMDGDCLLTVRLDGHRRALVQWVGRRSVVAHLVDRVGLLVELVLLSLLVRIGLVVVLGVLVLLVLQAHLHHHHPARVIPIVVKVRDHLMLMGMWL